MSEYEYHWISYNLSVGTAILKPDTCRMILKSAITSYKLFVKPVYKHVNKYQPRIHLQNQSILMNITVQLIKTSSNVSEMAKEKKILQFFILFHSLVTQNIYRAAIYIINEPMMASDSSG